MQMLKKVTLTAGVTLALSTLMTMPAWAEVKEYQFENGLKLIVKPDTRAPVAVTQIWYKVGSSYEYNGITGISHQLEHMMFKGTENLAPNEFSRIIAANGGRENAFTGRDYTAYFQTMEADRVEVSFKHEADRMRNLVIDEGELAKEKQVVAEERRLRTDDNPTSLTREAFYATAFMNSPYHHPIVGWMTDIDNYQSEDLREWYRKWYAPNNATIVVVGDVEPEQIYQLTQQYFGHLKAEDIATVKPQVEVPQLGKRTVEVKAPAELPYLMMGWKVPVVKTATEDWEPYALDMLASVLDGGESARFSKTLVRDDQVAANIGAGYSAFSRLDDLFVVAGTPAKDRTIAELEQAVMAQIERLKTELVSEQELERIKTQVIASKVYQQDSAFYQGMQIGILETIGLDWQLSEQYVDKIKAVTAEQVQAVANKYFVDKTLTVAELKPQPLDQQPSRQPVSGGRHGH